MRRLAIAATIAALTLMGGHAQAAAYLRYDFIAQSSFDGLFKGSFTGFLPLPPTTTANITGAALPLCSATYDGVSYACWAGKLRPDGVTPDGFGGVDVDANSTVPGYDQVEIWYMPPGAQPSDCEQNFGYCTTYAYIFKSGAFGTPGYYRSSLRTDPGGGPGVYAEQAGLLRVTLADSMDATSTVVPEPALWSLLIGGFGMAGAMLRAERRRLVPVKA